LVDEGEAGFDFEGMEDTMGMESEIDAAAGDFGGDMDMGGEDLSSEFEPSEEGLLNTAPDVDEGKTEILDEVYD
jgi:hypothetical protein